MDQLPAEVLHVICANIEQKDLFSLRLASKHLAHIGAHHIFAHGQLSFHLSEESLKRLEDVANNPTYATQIRTLSYDANFLAQLRTVENYKQQFERTSHHHPDPSQRPDPPGKEASERTKRLYVRNFEKWRHGDKPKALSLLEWMSEHMKYKKMVVAQKDLLKDKADRRSLAAVIPQFPHLEEIVYANNARCLHMLSPRNLQRFQKSFFPPLSYDTCHSVHQLSSMLEPMGNKLKTLKAVCVSPKLFSTKNRMSVSSSFRSLKKVHIELRLENDHVDDFGFISPRNMYATIEAGHLLACLVCANGLEDLHISFVDFPDYAGPWAHINKLVGNYSWPSLKKLGLSQVEGSAEELIEALARQPALQELGLGFVELTSGSWCQVFTEMRLRLSLQKTNFNDIFSSPSEDEMMVMEYYNQEMWDGDGCLTTLRDDIDDYVTEDHTSSGMTLEDLEWANPAARIEDYVSESELDGFGSRCLCGHCIENDSEDGEDDEEEEEAEDDDELMPDLVED